MKLSARNVLTGTVVDVTKGAVAAKVKIDIGGGHHITSTVTVEAVEELRLEKGKSVSAIIKASDIILGAD
ncbi:TOBE domain-containing protein [Pararhizobium haloflavum]|uniref:TOBE domain-containing protein n=1 Tax=Pararhizobium haloflavum TaxID=2037914 RepID=UPI000C19C32D|nr:TOBE domain-containing protein [Pararhizobium haloflavum]